MPARPSRIHLLCSIVLLLVLGSCSGRTAPPEAPIEAPAELSAALRKDALDQARSELERGQALARDGRWGEARVAFDAAVDLLLSLPGGIAGDEEAERLYDDVLTTIHEVERASVARALLEGEVSEQSESAAVDELTDAALSELAEEPAVGEEDIVVPEATYDVPIVMNNRVLSIIEMFQSRKRDWFQEALDRSGHFVPMLRRVFREEDLPEDLIYLAMVESAFKTRALSRAGARGMWQFIRATGRRYGLRQDFWVDDRFDPEKATRAAARHLKDLYEEFDDWYLAMAAYNCGARRVERAIRRTGSRDFWVLAKRRRLPRETRSYVPLILAAIVIAKSPEEYGFTVSSEPPRDYDVVRLDHAVDLSTAARLAETTLDEMKRLNPELRRWVTPLDRPDYPLRLPKGTAEAFRTALAEIPEEERVRFATHVVRRGDTLSHVAARYGTSVRALVAANGIHRRSLIHPGQVLTVPVLPGSGTSRARHREAVAEDGREVYVVRRGDTLGAIAASFRMSLAELRRLNGLGPRASRIYPGQRLAVSGEASVSQRAKAAPRPVGARTYVVVRGDTLGRIARAHGITLSTLRRLNGLSRRHSRIYPGQKLVVAATEVARAGGAVSYRIRRGDTLSTIARRFGVSVEELRLWNRIDSDRIVAGDSLTIYAGGGMN